MDNEQKPKPKKGTVGGGRAPGQLNKRTLLGKSVAETLRNMLGLDEESVARTGQIDSRGYSVREFLAEVARGERPPHPERLAHIKFLHDSAFGLPGKRPIEAAKRGPSILWWCDPPRGSHMPFCYAVQAAFVKTLPPNTLFPHDGECSPEPPAALQAPPDALKSLAAKVVIDAVATKGDTDAVDLEGSEGFETVAPEHVELPHEHGSRS